MAKNREVPKSLASVSNEAPEEDFELIAPESLFENFERNSSDTIVNRVHLSSPEQLFGEAVIKKPVKLKSPEILFRERPNPTTLPPMKKDNKKSTK